ncbi:MAG: META domain-containing protein [Actinomycetales bacterium]|nr:META domain-containing protein [Actinomycetales bacterium]
MGGSGVVGRSFRVVAIDGVPVLEAPTADITFGVDGRVTGRAPVNRFAGPYALDGAALTLGPLAGTLMAGPPEAMEQEQRLHRALSRRLTVVAGDGGRVELRDGADVALVLVAVEPDERM